MKIALMIIGTIFIVLAIVLSFQPKQYQMTVISGKKIYDLDTGKITTHHKTTIPLTPILAGTAFIGGVVLIVTGVKKTQYHSV
jgi:hypothetical protein